MACRAKASPAVVPRAAALRRAAFRAVALRAVAHRGLPVALPLAPPTADQQRVSSTCCGTKWSSKGRKGITGGEQSAHVMLTRPEPRPQCQPCAHYAAPPARPLGGFRLMSGCQHPSPRLSRGAWFLDPVPSPATDVAFHARSTCFSRSSLLFQFQLYIISNSSISVHIRS